MSYLDVGMISAIVCISYHLAEDALRSLGRRRRQRVR